MINKQRRENLKIIYLECPEHNYVKSRFGHGVELIYDNGENKYIVGFIEGFDWYKGLSDHVRVFLRSRASGIWDDISVSYEDVINDVKESARIVIDNGQFEGYIKGNVLAWANG